MKTFGRDTFAVCAGVFSMLVFVAIGYALEVNNVLGRLEILWPIWYWWFPLGSLIGGAATAAICRRPGFVVATYILLQGALTWGIFTVLDLMSSGHHDPRRLPIMMLEIPSAVAGFVFVALVLKKRTQPEG